MDYRHEWKHEISFGDLLTIRQRLQAVAKPDANAVNGKYEVRSLYFDTPSDKALREKLDGVSRREKFRIRYYNGDLSIIRLEKKSKQGGLGCKQSENLTAEEARAVSEGRFGWKAGGGRPLLEELLWKMKTQGIRPKTIVDYTREPFVCAGQCAGHSGLQHPHRAWMHGLSQSRLPHHSGRGETVAFGGQVG